jgi:hypothetical protein
LEKKANRPEKPVGEVVVDVDCVTLGELFFWASFLEAVGGD